MANACTLRMNATTASLAVATVAAAIQINIGRPSRLSLAILVYIENVQHEG